MHPTEVKFALFIKGCFEKVLKTEEHQSFCERLHKFVAEEYTRIHMERNNVGLERGKGDF